MKANHNKAEWDEVAYALDHDILIVEYIKVDIIMIQGNVV